MSLRRNVDFLVPTLVGFIVTLPGCTDSTPALSCPECDIQLLHELSLSSDDGPGISSWPTSLAVGPDGQIVVVAPNAGEERPLEFDRGGHFETLVGTVGEGPGEFERATYASFSADSLLVYDRAHGRIDVFGPDHSYRRTIAGIPQIYLWVELGDGSFVANRTDARFQPLVRFDRQGRVLANFGEAYSVSEEGAYLRPVRYLAQSSAGGIWSVQLAFEYRIQEWSPGGGLLRTIELDREWFPAYTAPVNPSPDTPPQSTVHGMWEHPSGLLWIVGVTADPDYRDGLGASRRMEGHDVYEVVDPRLVYDAVIEVVDPAPPARVVHHRRVSDHLFWAPEPGLLMSPMEDELGFVQIELWRPHLRSAVDADG